jgi:FlgD Ig-like domain
MKRNAPTILALLLLVGTATAFAVTQRLKLEPSPISQTRVDDVFSPACRCASKTANIQFSLRRADQLRIAVRTSSGEVTIAEGSYPSGDVHVRWTGRDASGEVVPDGVYAPLVHLQHAGRTIDLPNPIRVDTVRPTITAKRLRSNGTKLRVSYTFSEPAHGLLIVDGRRAVYTNSTRRRGRLTWYGRIKGRQVMRIRHRLLLVAVDSAGNRSAPVRLP